jgi:predicted short-subunit dehydrogenase-like oxidoreductase (DUF2520 family)
MRIALIGAGNLATHLGLALLEKNHQIAQVFSKTVEHASELGAKLNCPYTDKLADIVPDGDIYILAVKDSVIKTIVESVDFGDHLVAHTSGSVPVSVFENYCRNYGVIYPLQTFSKANPVDFNGIPVLTEGSDQENLSLLNRLASDISEKVIPIKSEQRLLVHLSAVFACNFVNHFYYIAEQLLNNHQLDLELLKPLIMETASKAMASSPGKVQTGPAVRKEIQVMEKHLEILSGYPEWERLYQLISENIYTHHKKEE